MTTFHSSQSFIKALRGSNDPPVAGGPSKIALVEQAWRDTSFRFPNKPEVIVDYLLNRFLKEKPSNVKVPAVGDVRYWQLLDDIISPSAAEPSTSTNIWLKTLLGHISIVPIVTTFLTVLKDNQKAEELVSLASSCLSVIWPLGAQKLTTEALLGCWTTFLAQTLSLKTTPLIYAIGMLLTDSYRQSLSNSSARKKIHTTFLQSQDGFKPWIEQILLQPQLGVERKLLTQNISLAGIETLFNVDILRQIQDTKDGDTLLHQSLLSLTKSHRNLVLQVLPHIYTHYIASLRKHKGTIFSAGSSNSGAHRPELNTVALQFFGFCQGLLDLQTRDALAWNTAFRLLEVTKQEHLYLSKAENEEASQLLTHNLELGLVDLQECWKDENQDLTEAIFKCMSELVKIDCDLILPTTPRILTRLLCIPSPRPQYLYFLDLLLEYHIKTRTLNEYIATAFSCLPLKSTPLPLDVQGRYRLCMSGPLLDARYFAKLSRTLRQFVTPGQCQKVAQATVDVLTALQEEYKSARKSFDGAQGKGSRKKRKSEAMLVDEVAPIQDPNIIAITFTLAARTAQVVLASLPLQSLPQNQAKDLQSLIAQFHVDFVQHQNSKLVKALSKQISLDPEDVDQGKRKRKGEIEPVDWSTQLTLASTLRLEYALERAKHLALDITNDEKLTARMVELLGDARILPELVLEITRTLLLNASQSEQSNFPTILGPILGYIEAKRPGSASSWSGQAHELSMDKSGRPQASLAVLHMVLDRWLATIDAHASPEQLSRLVKVIARLPLDLSVAPTKQLQPQHLLLRTLRSAQFWEFHNVRTALLAHLIEATNAFGDKASEDSIISVYQLLLLFPVEYFTKPSRAELVRRALAADRALQPYDTASKQAASSVLRLFLERTFRLIGTVEQQSPTEMVDFLLHLLDEPKFDVEKAYVESTLDLISVYFLEVFRQCSKSTSGEISKILSSYAQYQLYDGTSKIRAESVVRLAGLVAKELSHTNLSTENQTAFRDLQTCLASQLKSKITAILQKSSSEVLANAPSLLNGWHALLSLGVWLGIQDTPKLFGSQLAKCLKTLSKDRTGDWTDEVAVMTVAIIMQELHYRDPMEQTEQLDLAVAVYLSSLRTVSSSGRERVDEYVGRTSRLLSPDSYAHIFGLIGETLSQPGMPQESLQDLIHLASILLREHPQNTLKTTQTFVTTCINAFNGNDDFIEGPLELRLQVLGLLSQHCADRPAALRLLDMGGLWLLLTKFLTPSQKHDPSTSTVIFHKLIMIANSIIRLRRDLAVPMLPHLGMVLRQMLSSMRSCRPQLGSRQTEMVMNTQPRWIAAEKMLGVEEAKALARLLETLTTKTVPRAHNLSGAAEGQKAESLAGAFSKHASYVLKAYIEAMNEPLCIMSLEVRKELAPGLFALCGMINEHSRDAMMISALDAAGKVTLKALWKEYDKQRYVGKG